MSRGVSSKTKKMTISALLSAMGVALMFLGGLIETLDLTMAALASFFCIFAVIEMGTGYSFAIYAVTGILSLVLMPHSMVGWFYILFFGYYPILKERIERIKSILSWVIKLVVLNISLVASLFISSFIFYGGNMLAAFTTSFGAEGWGTYAAIGIYALVNVVFIVYDVALTRLISLYFFRIRHRLKFLNFK